MNEEQFMINEQLEEDSLRATIVFFMTHSLRDIGRRKFHFTLAFCSVFIVVLATLVINTVVAKGPMVFLRLAEGQEGEIDGFITPLGSYKRWLSDGNNHLFLNYTRFQELFKQGEYNMSPRKFFRAAVSIPNSFGSQDPQGTKLPSRTDLYRAVFNGYRTF